jgi:hypothetical protein
MKTITIGNALIEMHFEQGRGSAQVYFAEPARYKAHVTMVYTHSRWLDSRTHTDLRGYFDEATTDAIIAVLAMHGMQV